MDIHVEVASGINVSVEGVGDATGLERRLRGMLGSLPSAAGDRAQLRIRLVDHVAFDGSRIDWYARAGDDGVALTDHGRRLAVVPLPDLGPVEVVRDFDPRTFVEGVYVPLLRAAMWDHGGLLVRAAGVELHGRRLLVCGWHESGKTQLVLHVLRRGGALIGDDFVAVDRDGHVSCASAEVYVRPPARRASRLDAVSPSWLERLSRRMAPRSSALATVLWGARRLARQRRTVTLAVADAVPGGRPATSGPLDAVVLLRPGGRAAAPAIVARMLTRFGQHHFVGSVQLDALVTYLADGGGTRTLLPPGHVEEERLTRLISGTRLVSHPRTGPDGLSPERCDAILEGVF